MKILIVDNYDSFTFNLTALVRGSGCDFEIAKNDRLDFELVRRHHKILISPGPGVPSESGGLCDLIRTFSPEKSILGICLGHQAIGEVFGARLARLPRPEHGITRVVRVVDGDEKIFAGMPDEIGAGLYHSWEVAREGFPPCLKITAVTGDGAVMALAHRQFDVRGLQFHPESIMTAHGGAIINNWLAH